jgi:hypothetical protein
VIQNKTDGAKKYLTIFLSPKNNESPLGPDHLQKVPFVASNPILTHHQLQKGWEVPRGGGFCG